VPSSPPQLNHHHQHRDRGCPPESAHQLNRGARPATRQPPRLLAMHPATAVASLAGARSRSRHRHHRHIPAHLLQFLPAARTVLQMLLEVCRASPPVLPGRTGVRSSRIARARSLLKSLAQRSHPARILVLIVPAALPSSLQSRVRQSQSTPAPKAARCAAGMVPSSSRTFPARASGPRLRPGQA